MNAALPLAKLRALVLAPRGRDAAIAKSLVEQPNVVAEVCANLHDVLTALGPDVAFVLMTEDAVRSADLKPLVEWIADQPTWSDMPFILVTDHGGGPERNPMASRWLEALGNVSFVERPFHPTTLASIARTALKGRRRQYQTRLLFEDLREGEVRLRTALKAGNLGPWEFDFATRTLSLSEDFQNAYGPGEELSLETFLQTVHPDDRARIVSTFREASPASEDYAVEFRRRGADGAVQWIDARARMVRDELGKPLQLIGLSSDITERKAVAEALQQANDRLERRVQERTAQLQQAHDELLSQAVERERTEEQLRHMQKLESIGELTGGVAHDFNNLLTAVIGNLELLKKRVGANVGINGLVDGALQGAQRGAALTQRLLAFARRQALDPRSVDLAGLVLGMLDLLRRSIGPTVELDLDLPPSLPAVLVDPNQIELALLNLVVNARDAMPGGGKVSIALHRCNETAAAPDLAAGHYVCLRVSDGGVGMDTETLKRAIEPFFSTKGLGKGTGLGLSMVHGVAQQLKGALRLASEPGHGTVAELWLPVAADQAIEAPPAIENRKDTMGATLLLVDDDFLINLSTKALLEDLGHTVFDANSGARALEVLKKESSIELMITDYAMPGMTGVQLAEAARALRPGLPILLATGYAELPAGKAFDLPRLSKPYLQSQLAEQIAALLAPAS